MSTAGPSFSSEEIEEFSDILIGFLTKELTIPGFVARLKGSEQDEDKIIARIERYNAFGKIAANPIKDKLLELETQGLQLNDNPKGNPSSSREQIINLLIKEADKSEINGIKVLVNLPAADKRKFVEAIYDQSGFVVDKTQARKPSAPAKVAAPKGLEAALVKGPAASSTAAAAASSSATVNASSFTNTPVKQAAQPAKAAAVPMVKTPAKQAAQPAKAAAVPTVKSPAKQAAQPAKAPAASSVTANQSYAKASAIPAKAAAISSSSFVMKSPAQAAAKPAAPKTLPHSAASPAAKSPSLIFSKPSAQSLAAEAMAHRLAKPPAPPTRTPVPKAK